MNVVIAGMRCTGKSHLASVLVEEAVAHNRRTKVPWDKTRVVILAPSGSWWGIRGGKDGSPRGGIRALIIGGEHADIALDVSMGARIADLVDALGTVPILVQMNDLPQDDQLTLVTDFATRLAASTARRLLHLIIDDAESLYPSVPHGGKEARCAAALDRIVRKRRWHGIGVTTTTSRLSNLHGGATSQTQRLFVLRMNWPEDLKDAAAHAVPGADPEKRNEFCRQVAGLECGEAFHASWSEEFGHTRFKVRARRTFDSLATPGFDAKAAPEVKLASLPKRTLKIANAVLFPTGKTARATAEKKSKSVAEHPETQGIPYVER